MVRSYIRVMGSDDRIWCDQVGREVKEFITLKNPTDEYIIELTTDTKYHLEMEPIPYKNNEQAGIRIKFKRIKKGDM